MIQRFPILGENLGKTDRTPSAIRSQKGTSMMGIYLFIDSARKLHSKRRAEEENYERERERERERRERERGVAAPEKKASGGVSESHIKASVICKIGITTPRLIRPSVGLDSTSALKPAFMFAEGGRFA